MQKLTVDEFKLWAQYIYEICGIHLGQDKVYLVESRLQELLQTSGCRTFIDLLGRAKTDTAGTTRRQILDLITTGETSFFRDIHPFEMLRQKILPELTEARKKGGYMPPLRLWSCACSSGQELYSMAMVCREVFGDDPRVDLRLLGTDISDAAIRQASAAVYSKLEVERGLDAGRITRFFTQTPEGYKVRDELRGLATFRHINLMSDFNLGIKYDVIFCRNVAIYFNETDRHKLFERLYKHLAPDGFLVVGSTETLLGVNKNLSPCHYNRAVFYKPQLPVALGLAPRAAV